MIRLPSLAFVLVASCVALGACGGGGERLVSTQCAEPPRAQLAHFAGVPLPAGARIVQIRCEGFTDTFLRARIAMPRRALAAFERGARLTAPLRPGVRPFSDTPHDRLGWHVDAIRRVRGHEEQCDIEPKVCVAGLAVRRVLVDLDDPARAVVYLQAFTT